MRKSRDYDAKEIDFKGAKFFWRRIKVYAVMEDDWEGSFLISLHRRKRGAQRKRQRLMKQDLRTRSGTPLSYKIEEWWVW